MTTPESILLDLSTIPTTDLVAEFSRRRSALKKELAELANLYYRAPVKIDGQEDGINIVAQVAAAFRITEQDIMGPSSNAYFKKARMVAMVGFHQAGHPIAEVARYFGVDAGAVGYALKTVKRPGGTASPSANSQPPY